MKAWFLTGPRALELREIPDPEPGADEALVRVRAVGICGSDAECYSGKHPLPNYPRLPGHEFSGEIASVGPTWSGPPVGTRVAADPALSCGACYACRAGRHNCCVSVSIAGVHRPGAMAEYALCRASQLYPIPDDMSFETAAAVETLSIGAQAVRRGDTKPGDRVVILGAGPVGLCSLMMARKSGASVLVAERLVWRRELAAQFGAEMVVDPEAHSVAEAVRDFTDGYGAHVVIDATGEIDGSEAALALAGAAGRVVIMTILDEPMQVRPWQLVRQELTILGSRLSLADFRELVTMAASGEAPLAKLVTHRYPFAEAGQAFEAACRRPEGVVKAMVLPQE
jgi:2-desacetyl-2-hydroxyethyl bacteriochlorophyllide A dehydrogenase